MLIVTVVVRGFQSVCYSFDGHTQTNFLCVLSMRSTWLEPRPYTSQMKVSNSPELCVSILSVRSPCTTLHLHICCIYVRTN